MKEDNRGDEGGEKRKLSIEEKEIEEDEEINRIELRKIIRKGID